MRYAGMHELWWLNNVASADSATPCTYVVIALTTHACVMPRMFLARRLFSAKHNVRLPYNIYGAARG